MSDNEDVKRINRNIVFLNKRIAELRTAEPDNGIINALNREKFNQQKILVMLSSMNESTNHPINIREVLLKTYQRLGITSVFN